MKNPCRSNRCAVSEGRQATRALGSGGRLGVAEGWGARSQMDEKAGRETQLASAIIPGSQNIPD